jgi:hypothetical protein
VGLFAAATGAPLAGPLDVGLPPYQIAFEMQREEVGVGERGPGAPDLAAWPNPARSAVRLAWTLDTAVPGQLDVLDLQGRLVRTLHRGVFRAGANDLTWNLNDGRGMRVQPGIYVIRARAGDRVVTRRVSVVE